MNARISTAFLLTALAYSGVAFPQDAGERCQKGEPPPRPGLMCRPAFVEVEGNLHMEWDWDPEQILNAQQGDSIMSASCGQIGGLLRKVSPAQHFSHSGIMIEDRYQIRHSTGAEDRPADYGIGFTQAGSDGVREDILKYGWPGTITNSVTDAYGGFFLQDPESNEGYHLQPFNKDPIQCDGDSELSFATVVKPPPETELDPVLSNRDALWDAADNAKSIQGHYRFFAYTKAEYSFGSLAPATAGWASGTHGTVCSSFVRQALKDASFVLEGPDPIDDNLLESTDVDPGGAQVKFGIPDGTYLYEPWERINAGQWMWDQIYDDVEEQSGFWGKLFTDAPSDVANQVLNCFAHDWCGSFENQTPPVFICGDDELDSKDSECWKDVPRDGEAVSPDDMLFWDEPTKGGPYGFKEDLVLEPGDWVRVYRWGPDAGAGTVAGTVETDQGATPGVTVVVEGLDATDISDDNGDYEIIGIPIGPWAVQACHDDNGVEKGDELLMNMPLDGYINNADLLLANGCLPNVSTSLWHRKVNIKGKLKIVDHETFGSNEVGKFSINETLHLNPETNIKDSVKVTKCVGDEVRVELTFNVQLDINDRSVDVVVNSKLFEGADCQTDDLEAEWDPMQTVLEGATNDFHIHQVNEDWDGDDFMDLKVKIKNEQDI